MNLVTVPFNGDVIEAISADDRVWVSVRRVCEALRICPDGQRVKLREKEWACTEIISVHDMSGRLQELFVIDLESLPMWLATIETTRVPEEVRPVLVQYQKQAAKVLRDHFFGRLAATGGLPAELLKAIAAIPEVTEEVRLLRDAVQRIPQAIAEARVRTRKSRTAIADLGRTRAGSDLLSAILSAGIDPADGLTTVEQLLSDRDLYADRQADLERRGLVLTFGGPGRRCLRSWDRRRLFLHAETIQKKLLAGTPWTEVPTQDCEKLLMSLTGAERAQRSIVCIRTWGVELPPPKGLIPAVLTEGVASAAEELSSVPA